MADIFNEVEEELRKDKYQEWLRTYGPWVAGAAAAVILGVAGYEGWKAWSQNQKESASIAYSSAVESYDDARTAEAASAFEDLAANGPDGYAALALMRRGAMALENGDHDAAADFFEAAADRASDPIISDLAAIKAVWARFETYSADDLANRLSPLTGEGRPFRFLAHEAIGMSALQAGNYAAARQAFESIVYAIEAPQGVSARANAALAVTNQMDPRRPAEAAPDEAADPIEDTAGEVDAGAFNLGLDSADPQDAADDRLLGETLPELNLPNDEPASEGAQEDPN